MQNHSTIAFLRNCFSHSYWVFLRIAMNPLHQPTRRENMLVYVYGFCVLMLAKALHDFVMVHYFVNLVSWAFALAASGGLFFVIHALCISSFQLRKEAQQHTQVSP